MSDEVAAEAAPQPRRAAQPDETARPDRTAQPDEASWRGVAAEDQDEVEHQVGVRLQARSRRLLADLLRPHRGRAALLLALTGLAQLAYVAGPLLVAYGIDTAVPRLAGGDVLPTVLVVVGYLACGGVDALAHASFVRQSARLAQLVLLELRQRTFRHAQRLSVDFHERYTSGRLISRLSSDVETIRDLAADGLEQLTDSLLSVLVIAVTLMIYDWQLGLIALAAFIPITLLTRWYQRNTQAVYRTTRSAIAKTIGHFAETMNGIRAVQAFRREPRNARIFGRLNKEYSDANARGMWVLAVLTPLMRLIGNLTLVAVVALGAVRVIHGTLELGQLAAIALYVRRLYDPLEELAYFYNGLQSATAALEKISGLLEETPDVAEPATATPLRRDADGGLPGELKLDQVRFGYSAHADVLPDIRLDIPAGQTVAVVGATGAGKSTLAKLLARFYDPVAGAVRLDGVDLRELSTADLRRGVVMVTQESFLFSGSVADNIALGKPTASRAEIETAADAIGAGGFIRALPRGFDTDVRKRGGRLSAGQRQLVAFARAFLADPAVLILDEATASLDIPSERAVQRALHSVLAGRTAVIIAHRLSTVLIADRVLVMERGRIVQDGPPDRLIQDPGRFAELHAAWRASLV